MLAKYLFEDEKALIRIDMSEFMEKFSVSRMTGAPPGYVGYEEGGQLTEKVRRHPYSVVLLDEIEKAHPDVFNILLQILDDGQLTDGLGRKVDFKNTILIMTSNIGTRHVHKGGYGFNQSGSEVDYETMKTSILDETKRLFNPEFINRIDEMVVFRPLSRDHILSIIDIAMEDMGKGMADRHIQVSLSEDARGFLADKGYDPVYGARQIKRVIRRYVEDPLAEELLKGRFQEGDQVLASKEDEALSFASVEAHKPVPKKKVDKTNESVN
jgi:ATP-dependent Clp protease ATP-binding subunit ClpC